MRVLWQVEIDPFCREVLNKHWPDVPVYGDIREVRGKEVANVDVLCGGFPCQDISNAGRREGIQGARSSLWKEYARLVGEIRPRYVIVENVSALRSRGLDVVLADLSAFGYDAEWDCIRASDVGAPHRRDRLWLVAYPQCESVRVEPRRGSGPGREGAALAGLDGEARSLADADRDDGGSRRTRGPAAGGAGEPVAERALQDSRRVFRDLADAGDGGQEAWRHWAVEPDVGRVADGVPARVDRLRALGNALVPQIAEWIGRRILAYEEGCPGVTADRPGHGHREGAEAAR